MITIEKISSPDEKSGIVTAVLADLPEWFGLPESTHNYICEARDLLLLAARHDGKYIGFITFKKTSDDTVEVHCTGVLKQYHRQGIGRMLFLRGLAEQDGKYSLVQVKTVDVGLYKAYDMTNMFYSSLGFKKLEVFPEMWDPWNPCLMLVKPLWFCVNMVLPKNPCRAMALVDLCLHPLRCTSILADESCHYIHLAIGCQIRR